MRQAPFLDNPFWQFSLAFYGHSDVEQHCLELQAQGYQVNLVLFCLWHASEGRGPLSLAQLDGLQQQLAPSERGLQPLRHSRQQLKALPDSRIQPLRAQLKQAELTLENYQQQLLYQQAAAAHSTDSALTDAHHSLNHYAQQQGQPPFDMAHPLLVALDQFLAAKGC